MGGRFEEAEAQAWWIIAGRGPDNYYAFAATWCWLSSLHYIELAVGSGWIAVAAAFIIGAINFARGDSEKGQKYVVGAIIGAIVMGFYTAITTGLIG